jgi:hypothetical protein
VVVNNLDEVLDRPEFLKMTITDVMNIFSSDDLSMKEIEIFDHLMRWMAADMSNRRPLRDQWIDVLRIGLFAPKDLAKIRQHPILRDNPKFKDSATKAAESLPRVVSKWSVFGVGIGSFKLGMTASQCNAWLPNSVDISKLQKSDEYSNAEVRCVSVKTSTFPAPSQDRSALELFKIFTPCFSKEKSTATFYFQDDKLIRISFKFFEDADEKSTCITEFAAELKLQDVFGSKGGIEYHKQFGKSVVLDLVVTPLHSSIEYYSKEQPLPFA